MVKGTGLALTLALMVGALSTCGGGTGSGPRLLVGFNEDPNPRWFHLQAELNMPVRRFPIGWNAVEATRGHWTWRASDALYRKMRRAGLRPLIVAIGAPCWARELPDPCAPGPPAPAFDAAWAGYVRRLASRYPAALAIEVWNEPNSTRTFPPYPNAARYTALLKSAYRAAKSVDPRTPVVSGGLLPSLTTNRYAVADAQFLRAMYAAGAKPAMDGIGAHPYPLAGASGLGASRYDPAAMEQDLNRLRAVRNAAGDSQKPIWITEMGVSTQSGGRFPIGATQAQQAADLLTMLGSAENDGDVRVALIHRLIDTPATPPESPLATLESGFGVFNSTGVPKLAACGLSSKFGGSLSC